jgi:CRP/FNR family transcriptional regulator
MSLVQSSLDINALKPKLLECFPVFAGLKADALDSALAQASLVRAPQGTILFDAKQPCRGFPLLLEGTVRVSKTAANGREILLYHVDPGQACVLSGGCLLGHADYTATAVAECDVMLITLAPEAFHKLLLSYEPFRRFVFGMYGDRLAEVMELVEEVAFSRLDVRLAQLLIHRGPVVETTHQKLAVDLGSVREIISRLLRSFESRGWVRLEREKITVLDPRALAQLSANSA